MCQCLGLVLDFSYLQDIGTPLPMGVWQSGVIG